MKIDTYEVNYQNTEENQRDIDIDKDDDKALSAKIALRLGEAKSLHDRVVKEGQDNMQIFKGEIDKVAGIDLAKYKSKAILNKVYLTIRNLVGLSTDNPPVCDIAPAKDQPQSIKKAGHISANIEYGMMRTNFNDLLSECLFETWIKKDSYLHWFWNYDKNDFDVIGCSIDDCSISPEATSVQDSEYFIYHPKKNRKWFKDNYPDLYEQVKFEQVKPKEVGDNAPEQAGGRGTVARLYSYWENDLNIAQVMGKDGEWLILEKKKNPYFEYRDPTIQFGDWIKQARPNVAALSQKIGVDPKQLADPQDVEQFQPIINFLSEPRKPFVQIPSVKMLGEKYSTNLIGQIREVLISYINKKRQIADNLQGCNQKIIVDSNAFSEEEQDAITDEPNQVIAADFNVSQKPVYIEKGGEIPNSIMEDMLHDERYMDDVFGHHEISRGAGKANTLGQDKMNYIADQTPVRFQVRATERAIKEVWEGWIQLMKMFYTETHYVKKLGAKEGIEMIELTRHDIEEGIEPILRPLSTAPNPKQARIEQALTLWNSKATDPYTLFVDLEYPNPTERADRLINFMKFGIISDEDPDQIAADMQNQATSPGGGTDNPIERANQENLAFQGGEGSTIPPTSPEFVTKEHVMLHFQFLKDPKKKMDQENMDLLEAHARADKATLVKLMAEGKLKDNRAEQAQNGQTQPNQPNAQQNANASQGGISQ
jgi:hypothetical protein